MHGQWDWTLWFEIATAYGAARLLLGLVGR